jgi:hypothetical protein
MGVTEIRDEFVVTIRVFWRVRSASEPRGRLGLIKVLKD